VTARRRAGREAQALPGSLHRSVAAPVRTRLGPRGFQPETQERRWVEQAETAYARYRAFTAVRVRVHGFKPEVRYEEAQLVPDALLQLIERWRNEAIEAGRTITRIVVAFEAGRDGFWLARWLKARGMEAFVIHSTSIAVPREHRRAKTDRLDTELLKRAFLGWLRGEPDHCHMDAIPTPDQEDAKRPNRERENLIGQQTRIVNRMKACLVR
jgi:transposase